ncbi:MAG: MBL fold metallo-hydrolase [Methanobacteriaceae archaeon]|nr:MBL fold metallo-hydrolase [Methanobacteriaceae archaeon]
MSQEIKTIHLKIFGGLASVNCYLVRIEGNFILIDTGDSRNRNKIDKELEKAGCTSQNLKLILLTHGDTDHTGNCAFIRDKYSTRVAMHLGDLGMVEKGDMLYNREGNIISRIISPFMGLSKSNRFTPDILVDDGYDLNLYGWDARVIHIPGHSSGSIGVLTVNGEFFCGDLFSSNGKASVHSIMDDKVKAKESIEKLKKLNINQVYPGHGEPFPWTNLTEV